MTALLEVRNVSISFSGLRALDHVSFSVKRGQIFGLIGPNGAGKSTLLNCVSRLYTPDTGDIVYDGHRLLEHKVHELAGLGIRRTFQNLELFAEASVRENVALGAVDRHWSSVLSDLLGLPSARRGQKSILERADALLAQAALSGYADAPVPSLPYGLQKSVELARALASDPKLLLLDEPAAGTNPEESKQLGEKIRRLRDESGITVVLVEHDMALVMSICDHIVALDHGEKISEGTPVEVRANAAVVKAYLGDESEDA